MSACLICPTKSTRSKRRKLSRHGLQVRILYVGDSEGIREGVRPRSAITCRCRRKARGHIDSTIGGLVKLVKNSGDLIIAKPKQKQEDLITF